MRNRLKSAANRDLKFIDFFKLYVIYIGVVDLIVYLGILKNSNKFLFLAIPIFILILLSGVDGFLRTIKNLSQIAAVRWTLFSGFGTAFITAVTVTYYAGEANNRFINSLAWLSIGIVIPIIFAVIRSFTKMEVWAQENTSALLSIVVALGAACAAISLIWSPNSISSNVHITQIISESQSEPKITDWIIAVGTVVAALGAVAAFYTFMKQVNEDRVQRSRPPRIIYELLSKLEEAFAQVIVEGKDSLWFLDPDRKSAETTLDLFASQINDPELLEDAQFVIAAYKKCIALAHDLDRSTLSTNLGRIENQAETARLAHTICGAAKVRYTELTLGDSGVFF